MKDTRYWLAAALLPAVLALPGCGGTVGGGGSVEDTNGLERKTAAEVVDEAAAALRAAKSVRAHAKGDTDTGTGELEVRIEGTASSGTLTIDGMRTEIVKIGDRAYVRGDEAALTEMGMPAELASLGTFKWLELSEKDAASVEGFTLDDLADQLTDPDSELNPQVEQTALDGRPVVKVTRRDGAELYVSNAGTAYPLRLITTGDEAAQADFSEYGAEFGITTPSAPVDLDKVSVAPGLAAEFKWLEAIAAMPAAMDEAIGDGMPQHQQAVAALADKLRRCTRELVAPGPPSARMQPVHDVVVKGCQEYDKGADCLAELARIWNQPESQDLAKVNELLHCGLDAQDPGGRFLSEAGTAGLGIVMPS